jgi:hypothetical protein
MTNKVVIFPVDKQAAAQAYLAWCNTRNPDTTPGAVWGVLNNDAFGQWVVPYLGPPFAYAGAEVAEPEGGPAMRADGVLHDTVVWPVYD